MQFLSLRSLNSNESIRQCSTIETQEKERKHMEDLQSQLAQTLSNAIAQLRQLHVPDEYVVQIEHLIEQPDDTCVVAVVGRVKAGKSTFINALLQDDLAPIGVTETTATINYFRYGLPDSPDLPVRCKWRERPDLEPQSRAFLRSLQGNDSETLRRAEQIEYLEYLLPHPYLQQVTLVDTPGVESAVDRHQNVTAEYMRLFGQLRGQHEQTTRRLDSSVDAVIYLLGDVSRAEDQKFLQEFARLTGLRSQTTNAIGVMAKIDLQEDFPHGTHERAAKYAFQLKNQLNTVVPVSAGLQRALDRLRANNWADLIGVQQTLCRIESQQLEMLLRSAELFVGDWDTIECPVSATERKEMLETLEWLEWTIFRTIVKETAAAGWNVAAAVERLTELAGFEPLKLLLKQRFLERGELIRSYRILNDASKIIDEIRDKYIPLLHEKNATEKAKVAQFLVFLRQDNTPGTANVRRELAEFIIERSATINHAEQAEQALILIKRVFDQLRHVLKAVPDDLEALQLLDNAPSLFSDSELEELRALFGRNATELASRLLPEQRNADYIYNRARHWQSISSKKKPPMKRIAEHAYFRYAHLLDETSIR